MIDFGGISLLINIQNLFVLIISKTYQVDRFWRHITVEINIQDISMLIEFGDISILIEFGVLSVLINIQNLSTLIDGVLFVEINIQKPSRVDRYPEPISVDKHPKTISGNRNWSHIHGNKHPKTYLWC